MRKQFRPPRKRTVLGLALLAVLCIGAAELTASYFFAPELFEKVTAPVRNGAQAVVTFCGETAAGIRQSVTSLLSSLEKEEDAQFADTPLIEVTTDFADPAITELKNVDGKEILTGGIVSIEYFNQAAEAWAGLSYGTDDIGRYGCGPTAMAMVINSMTDHETDPAQMAEWAVDNHHWARKSGSYLSIVEGGAEAFGLTACSMEEKTPEAIRSTLLSGNLIVALMGPGHFTKGGHFILIHGVTLSGSVLVADPNSTERSLMEWDPQLILDELSASTHDGAPLWAISQ